MEAAYLHFALVSVHQKGDLGEGEEGNAERQNDLPDGLRRRSGLDCQRKIGVFEITQQQTHIAHIPPAVEK